MSGNGGTETTGYSSLAVIIVNWNRFRFLRELLLDLQQQSHPANELIVVDNGSDDGSPEMVECEFREVRLIRLPRNMGVSHGRNVGIEASRSELLMFPDNDLRIPDRSFLRRARDSADSHPDCGLINFEIIDVIADGGCMRRNQRFFGRNQLGAMVDDAIVPVPKQSRYTGTFAGGASLVRRDTFDRVGTFDPSLWYGGEESDFSFRCHSNNVRFIRDARLWVVHNRCPEMRPGFREGAVWKHETIVLARYMPVPDLMLALACQVARALIAGGGAWSILKRMASIWDAVCFSIEEHFTGKRTPCCRSTLSRYYRLSVYEPERYDYMESPAMGSRRYWFLRIKSRLLRKWSPPDTGKPLSWIIEE